MTSKISQPSVVHVGKRKKKDVAKLAKGGGPLMDEVMAAVARAQGAADEQRSSTDSGPKVVPVVLVYEQKPRRKKRGMAIMGPVF